PQPAPGAVAADGTVPGGEAAPLSGAGALNAPPASETDYGDMRYMHYDMEYFSSRADRMCALAEENDAEAVNGLYDELYREMLKVDSLTILAMLRHDADYYNDYWSGEYTYMYAVWDEAWEVFLSACNEVLSSPCARTFTSHIGTDTARVIRSYDGWTRDAESSSRELELLDEYYALQDTYDQISFTYEGESWNIDKLYGFSGNHLAYWDYDAYWTIYIGIQQAISEAFAPLYIELVGLWTEEARAEGYDSYTPFAYELIYGRDYTPEDAQRFCDEVKPIARKYYEDLYYSDLAFAEDTVSPVLSPSELLDTLGAYLPRIDPALAEPWEQMTEHGLYDLAGEGAGRYDGSYTTNLAYWRSPFLFATLSGDCNDLITVTHEFGHFADYWFSPQTNAVTQTDDLDLSEIHSNALQALFTEFYGEIYDEGADAAEFINLAFLLESVFDGCMFDEFQRRILDDPDGLTPEKINDIYTRVCAEYGLYYDQEWDGSWTYISHNFEQPLYYISYAASAIAALQIWDLAQTDFDAAAAVYVDVLSRGAHDEGYIQVLEECGLRLVTEEGTAADVCRPVLDRLYELDRAGR
ncbi:MAG: hypothetical protein IKD79_01315, partial [Oscillospiraceae bacterium]|nr:hypothetical protein [Oscillospiraceae bacterium]